MIRKRINQKEIPTPKTEVGKTIRYLYLETYRKPSEQYFPTYIKVKQHKNSTLILKHKTTGNTTVV